MENFYVLYGMDKSMIQYELKKILKKLKVDDIIKYDIQTSSLLDIIEDASTVSMFSSKKAIILEDCYFLTANKTVEHQETLEQYLEHYNPDNYCIFLVYNEKLDTRKKLTKLLSKHKVIELKSQDQEYLKKYVEEYLKEEGYQIENSSYFIEKVGSNIHNIKNELDKLMMYRLDTKSIQNEDIDKITIRSMEDEIFTLTDAIIAKDTEKSLKLLEEFLNRSYDEIQIIMLLASQFRFFFQVKRLLNKNKAEAEIAKTLEANPYRVKFTIKKLYSYSETMLLDYIQRIAKMDHDIKLGIMDKNLALQLFITMNY